MNSEWQSLPPQTQQELKNTMNAMQPPQSVEEIKAGLETTEKGGVRQSIRNCLTVFQRDPLLSGAIAGLLSAIHQGKTSVASVSGPGLAA